MRIESAVTSITWIPSEAVEGMPKLPFELGVAHYDEPPPDVLGDLEKLREKDASARRTSSAAGSRSRTADRRPRQRGSRSARRHDVSDSGRPGWPSRPSPFRSSSPSRRSVTAGSGSCRPQAGGWASPRRGASGEAVLPARVGLGVDDARADHPCRRALKGSLVGASPFPVTGSTTTRGSSSRSRGRSTSRRGTASPTARTRPGATRSHRPRRRGRDAARAGASRSSLCS